MIKSAIFGTNNLNMSPRSILLFTNLLFIGLVATAQYTEKINTNRPGTSQGAFSVGNNVLQLESGIGFGKEKHDLFKTKTNLFNFDYAVRYGLLIEQLEISLQGRLRSDAVRQTVGANEEKIGRTNFEYNTLGAKYLIYDPYKKPRKDEDSLKLVKLKSWKETHKFRFRNLIPAVSAYVGVNFNAPDNPFTFPNDKTISPKFVIATQNNWYNSNAGSWVLVTNFIVDKITTDIPLFGWIITSTHTINEKIAIFGEYQGQKSDFYSDDILRLGAAYLFNKDFQIDANIATNFKDTPSVLVFSAGASYRFDWHKKDEIIEEPGLDEFENAEEIEEEIEDGEDREIEEIESDSLKAGRQPFVNEFEDEDLRSVMEQDLDERRTAEREERERIEAEKQGKKDDKKFQKEERRRLKREAQKAKKAGKAKLKAEKEKQKMIEDIDAELNKMEQDEDDELRKIEEELKLLEEADPDLTPKKKEEKEDKQEAVKKQEEEKEEDVDAAYDKLQKEQEGARKKEEKRQKAAEKKQLKEEKKRKKEEEKRRKAEEDDK